MGCEEGGSIGAVRPIRLDSVETGGNSVSSAEGRGRETEKTMFS